MKPNIIKGNIYEDRLGKIRHTNDFKLKNVCRFYTIEHIDTKSIRAWQGHQVEAKYFVPIRGSFVVAWVKIDNFNNPSTELKAEHNILPNSIASTLSLANILITRLFSGRRIL